MPAESAPRSLSLVAARSTKVVAGQEARLQLYDGQLPGPTLVLREGEKVALRLENRLDEPTNLHLHGVPIAPAVDDPRVLVDPGQAKTYEFEVLPGSAGTYWYHPHGHGSVGPQLFAGLSGPLIVEPAGGAPSWLAGVPERVLLLKDLALSGGDPAPHTPDDWLNGKEGDLVLVNGEVAPRIDVEGGAVRLRLVNASNARYFRLHVEGHELVVLGAGIGFAEAPAAFESFVLAPGERVEACLRLSASGEFRLLALPYDRGADMSGMSGDAGMPAPEGSVEGMLMHGHGGMAGHRSDGGARLGNRAPVLLATLVAPGAGPRFELPPTLSQERFPDAGRAEARRPFVLSEDMLDGRMRFLINGREFDAGRIDFRCRLGSVEHWEIRNEADMDHPFHLHVFPFVVVSRNGAPEPLRMWRDTVNLAAGASVEILVPFNRFTGTVMYHCHIVEHEDLGMMGLFEVVEE
jgi:FtsP/CotA-like multicopper oxidase with cupredoxin domain